MARAEETLKVLRRQGFLSSRTVVLRGAAVGQGARSRGGAVVRVFGLTATASNSLSLPHAPKLRDHFLVHHLKTLEALSRVGRGESWVGGTVESFRMEPELVQQLFAGRTFRPGTSAAELGKLPDAQALVRRPDGSASQVNVEYVTRSYTDAMILEKATAWAGTPTIWACSDAATAARVESITGHPALVV